MGLITKIRRFIRLHKPGSKKLLLPLSFIFIYFVYSHRYGQVPVRQSLSQWNSSIPQYFNADTLTTKIKVLGDILFIYSSLNSAATKELIDIFKLSRFSYYKMHVNASFDDLSEGNTAKYAVILFPSVRDYLGMTPESRRIIRSYCTKFSVSQILFTRKTDYILEKERVILNYQVFSIHAPFNFTLNRDSPIWKITKSENMVTGFIGGTDWAELRPISRISGRASTMTDIAQVKTQSSKESHVVSFEDINKIEGLRQIFIGGGLSFWANHLIFIDALLCVTKGAVGGTLIRNFLVEIDDIFLGNEKSKLKVEDIKALLNAQDHLSKTVKNFRYSLGFSGFNFRNTSMSTDHVKADDLLIASKDKFWWYPQTWSYTGPNQIPSTASLLKNIKMSSTFAKRHALPTIYGYAVSRYDFGIYPVVEPLYTAWRKVLKTTTTSTTMYYTEGTHGHYHNGFMHSGIRVLPRQYLAGIASSLQRIKEHPGGLPALDRIIYGGPLFLKFLYNPINIFLTHSYNYGGDRVAIYTFLAITQFIIKWTNIELATENPVTLASRYFTHFPEDKSPLWENICVNRALTTLIPQETLAKCKEKRLPDFLIVGPPHTGTSYLRDFLLLHPSLKTNFQSRFTVEEIQFFSREDFYTRGLGWYMTKFPNRTTPLQLVFEKSATYFSYPTAPKRVHAVVPEARIFTVLRAPEERAYSYYQFMRKRKDPVASNYSLWTVLSSKTPNPPLMALRHRCLDAGLYAAHLSRWLQYFSPAQVKIIDENQWQRDPVRVLTDLQNVLRLQPKLPYDKMIKFDEKKRHFCTQDKKPICLGSDADAKYPSIDTRSEKFLKDYYAEPNKKLTALLKDLERPLPAWLRWTVPDSQ